MISDEELALLTNAILRAADLAQEQLWTAGHRELVNGLRRAIAIRNEALEKGTHHGWRSWLRVGTTP